jgi:hypothetical protein
VLKQEHRPSCCATWVRVRASSNTS